MSILGENKYIKELSEEDILKGFGFYCKSRKQPFWDYRYPWLSQWELEIRTLQGYFIWELLIREDKIGRYMMIPDKNFPYPVPTPQYYCEIQDVLDYLEHIVNIYSCIIIPHPEYHHPECHV